MRANLDDNLARRVRQTAGTYGTEQTRLLGSFVISASGPTFLFIDPNGANRTVFLPPLHVAGGQFYIIANISGGFQLDFVDSGGGGVVSLAANSSILFFSSSQGWRYFTQGGGSAAQFFNEPEITALAAFTIGGASAGVLINRVAPVTTTITLPAIAVRAGFPLRIVDVSTGIVAQHTITVLPDSPADKIMQQTSWSLISNDGGLTGITLWPSSTLGTWYFAP